MFPIAIFTLSIFLFYVTMIVVHTQLWTKQSNVRTNTKYTSHVNSFLNTSVEIYSNDLTRTKKHDIKSTKH